MKFILCAFYFSIMNIISYDQAFALANKRVKSTDPEYQYCSYGVGSEIIAESTQEIKNGWLFFYQSKEEIEANKYADIKGINEEGNLSIKNNTNILLGG